MFHASIRIRYQGWMGKGAESVGYGGLMTGRELLQGCQKLKLKLWRRKPMNNGTLSDQEIEKARRQQEDALKLEQPHQVANPTDHQKIFLYLSLLQNLYKQHNLKGFSSVQQHYVLTQDLHAASDLARAFLGAMQGKREQRGGALAERLPLVEDWRIDQ